MASLLAKTCNRLSTPAFSAATSEPGLVESAPLESAPAEAVAHSTGTAVEGARKLLSVDSGEPGPEQAPVSTIRTAPPKLMVSPPGAASFGISLSCIPSVARPVRRGAVQFHRGVAAYR